jgi:hypothetical protein
MKCISILQPWASLVVTTDPKTGKAYKQIETRSWDTKYRGPLLIHASKKGMLNWMYQLIYDWVIPYNKELQFTTGAIIGMVNLVDTFKMGAVYGMIEQNMSCFICGKEVDFSEQEVAFGHYEPNRYGWLLSDPILFHNPIPCKGNLSLWNLPVNIWKSVLFQLQDITGDEYYVNDDDKIDILGNGTYTPSLIATPGEGAVIVEPAKNCYSCKHNDDLVTQEPCATCFKFSKHEPIELSESSDRHSIPLQNVPGHATYIGNPDLQLVEAMNKMAGLAYKTIGSDISESKLHLPSRGIDGHNSLMDELKKSEIN